MDVDGEPKHDEYDDGQPLSDAYEEGGAADDEDDSDDSDGGEAEAAQSDGNVSWPPRKRARVSTPREMAPPPVLTNPADLSAGLAFPTKAALLAALATHFIDGHAHKMSEHSVWDSPPEEDRRKFGCLAKPVGGGKPSCQFRVFAGKYKDGRW